MLVKPLPLPDHCKASSTCSAPSQHSLSLSSWTWAFPATGTLTSSFTLPSAIVALYTARSSPYLATQKCRSCRGKICETCARSRGRGQHPIPYLSSCCADPAIAKIFSTNIPPSQRTLLQLARLLFCENAHRLEAGPLQRECLCILLPQERREGRGLKRQKLKARSKITGQDKPRLMNRSPAWREAAIKLCILSFHVNYTLADPTCMVLSTRGRACLNEDHDIKDGDQQVCRLCRLKPHLRVRRQHEAQR